MIGITFVVVFFERLALSKIFDACMHLHPVIEWPLDIQRCDLSSHKRKAISDST